MDATSNIATDLFYKIRSRFSGLKLGDAGGKITINPEEARFFDFDYKDQDSAAIGHVSISLAEENSIKVYFSSGITESMDTDQKKGWYGFLKELRHFAKRRLMAFDTRDIAKDNLDKRDYAFLTQHHNNKSQDQTQVGESIMNESAMYGNRTTSYQKLLDTKLIIKHSKALVDDQQPGARARNISALFVENQDGERFKYPFIHLAGARAMQRHVANGGLPYDDIGKSIISMSEELSHLRGFSNYVVRNDLMNSETNGIVNRSQQRLEQIKEQIAKLSKQSYYENYKENFQNLEPLEIPQDVIEDFTDKFTVRNFKEDIKSVFPILYRLMKEDSKVDYKDIVSMVTTEANDTAELDLSEDQTEFDKFENWILQLGESSPIQSNEEQILAIRNLNKLTAQAFPAGADGINAIPALRDIINDPQLYAEIKEQAKVDNQFDVRPLVKQWLETNAKEIADQIDFGDMVETPAGEEVAEPAVDTEFPAAGAEATAQQPAAQQPAATGSAVGDLAAGAEEEQVVTQSDDNISRGGRTRFDIKELAEFIQSFYDRDSGTFPKGPEGVCTMVGKKFGEQAESVARKFVERMAPQQATDRTPELQELSRIRSLAGMKTDEDYRAFTERGDLQKLRDAINDNVIVSVAFVKKDGTVRHMGIKRTLGSYVPSEREKTDRQANVEQNNDIKKVIDINAYIKKLKELKNSDMEENDAKAEAAKVSWRSINLKNVLGFMVKGEFIDLRDENDIKGRFGDDVYDSLTPAMKNAMTQSAQTDESFEESAFQVQEASPEGPQLAGVSIDSIQRSSAKGTAYIYDPQTDDETEVTIEIDFDRGDETVGLGHSSDIMSAWITDIKDLTGKQIDPESVEYDEDAIIQSLYDKNESDRGDYPEEESMELEELGRVRQLAGLGKKNLTTVESGITMESGNSFYNLVLEDEEIEVTFAFERDGEGKIKNPKIIVGTTDITAAVDEEEIQYLIDETDPGSESPITGVLLNLDISVDFDITGEYEAPSFYSPGSNPDLELGEIEVLGKNQSVDIKEKDLDQRVLKKIEKKAWEHAEEADRYSREEAEIDRYELSRNDYNRYESIDLLKKLSGI